MEDQTWPARPIYSRRRILALGGAAAAAAAILAACGSDDDASDATTAPAGDTAAPRGDTTAAPVDTAAPTPDRDRRRRPRPPAAGGSNAAKFGGGGGDGTVKIGFTAPLTGPLAGFGEANPFILEGINKLDCRRHHARRQVVQGRDHPERRRVQQRHRGLAGRRADPRRRGRHDAGHRHTGDDQPGRRPVRGQRCAVPQHAWRRGSRTSSAAAATRPTGFDWTYHFFWGAEQLVGVFVEHVGHRSTPTRRSVCCAPTIPTATRSPIAKTGFPAGAAAAGYTHGRPRPLRDADRRLQQHHRAVQGRRRRDRRRHPDPARLRHLLDAGQPAGLQPEADHDGQGRAVLVGGRGPR